MSEVNKVSTETTEKPEKVKQQKKSKFQRRRARRRVINTLMGIIIFCTLLGLTTGVSTIYLILNKSDVVLDLAALGSSEVSFIYDDKGNEIARLGVEDRVNITFNDLPQCVVDAFVAVEDSRYFEHPGFDMPRFAKAFLENIASLSFSQGGSTITMQVIKNSYFAVDTIAVRDGAGGIARKVQEIYYSLKINNLLSKGRLLELYINKINYGGTARGIEVAADYYFGKSARDLTLVEAAYLAGVVNAPNDFNVYVWPKDAQIRTRDVLYQMHYHGYITDEEYAMAKKINIADLVVGANQQEYGTGKTVKNQAYIDVVVNELETLYDINVYTDSVRVYTAMNQTVQTFCDNVSDGKIIGYPDKYVNYASAIIQNKTGLIVGLCGGRDYDRARKFNYAVDARVQPGSTAKAIITYPFAFEYGGVATTTAVKDEKITYQGTNIVIHNYGGGYSGWVTVENAINQSLNIPAIKVFRKAQAAVGIDRLRSHLKAIGFDTDVANLADEQYAIGGGNCIISPLQLAAACTPHFNGGKYITPHTITKIEYINSTKEPIVPTFNATQVESPGTAFIMAYLLNRNVNQGGTARSRLMRRGYAMYAKTGTTSLPDYMLKKYNIAASTAGKDLWLLSGNGDYTMGSWYGYDLSVAANSKTYFTYSEQHQLRDGKIAVQLWNTIEQAFGKPKFSNKQTSDVTSLKFVKGIEPFMAIPSWAPKYLQMTGYVLSKHAKLTAWETPKIDSLSGDITLDQSGQTVTVTWNQYPDAAKLKVISAGKQLHSSSDVNGVVRSFVNVLNSDGEIIASTATDKNSWSFTAPVSDKDETYKIRVWYAYTIAPVNSNTLEKSITIPKKETIIPNPNPNPNP